MDQFKQAILDFNKQLTIKGLNCSRLDKLNNTSPDSILIIGMGGSGQVGNIISDHAADLNIPVPVLIWKNCDLPPANYKNPLYIFISFSGNTEETISGFKMAKSPKAVVCSGGQLKELADGSNSPLVIVPAQNLKPRQATGHLFYGAMAIIKTAFPQTEIPDFTDLDTKSSETTAKKIAQQFKNKTILIYSSPQNNHLAYIWKTTLNETAKTPAFANTFPEAVHNEITLWDKPQKNIFAVFLTDENDHPHNKKKIDVITKIFKTSRIPFLKITLEGKSPLEKSWRNIILSNWVSYHLAKLKGASPSETILIDKIKKLMKQTLSD